MNDISPGGLVLNRSPGEGLVILLDGKVCEVNVIRMNSAHEVVIQIKAPKEVKIIRRELLAKSV